MVEEKFASIKDQPAGSEFLATGRRLAERRQGRSNGVLRPLRYELSPQHRPWTAMPPLFTAFNIGMKDGPRPKRLLCASSGPA